MVVTKQQKLLRTFLEDFLRLQDSRDPALLSQVMIMTRDFTDCGLVALFDSQLNFQPKSCTKFISA